MVRTNAAVVTLLAALVLAGSVPASPLSNPHSLIDPDLKWATPAPPGQYWLSLDIADIDGDGLDEVLAGSSNALYALDGETGLPLWRTPTGGIVHLRVTDLDRDGDQEVVTVGLFDPASWACTPVAVDWTVRVFDAATGAPLATYLGSVPDWKIGDLKTADLTGDGVQEVVVSTYGWDEPKFNGVFTLDGAVLLDAGEPLGLGIAGDEALLWTHAIPNTPIMRPQNIDTYADPDTEESVVFLAHGNLKAINGTTGETLWRHRDSADVVQVAGIMEDNTPEVMINGGNMEIFEPLTGDQIKTLDPAAFTDVDKAVVEDWVQPLNRSQQNSATVVIQGGGRLDGEAYNFLWGVNAEAGTLQWTVTLDRAIGSVIYPPILQAIDLDRDGNEEIVLAEGDSIHLPGITPDTYHRPRVLVVDAVEGRILWEHWMPGAPTWHFDTGDLDGQGNKEIVTGLWRFIAAWEPTLEDRSASTDRGDEQFRTGATCITPD